MILSKVYEDAERRLERNEITLGEFERLMDIEVIEPKQGEWKLFYESKDGDNVYKCSCCRFITVIPEGIKLFSFCPNCGARMKGVDDE